MIKKIKDIFYDLNDILVALIIIAAAALVIVTNIDSILAYPSSIAAEIQIPEEDAPTNYAENPAVTGQSGGDADAQGAAGAGDEQDSDGQNAGGQNSDGQNAGGQNSDGQNAGGQNSDGQNAGGTDGQHTAGDGVSGQPGTDGSGSSGGGGPGTGQPANITVSIPSGSTGDKIADILIGVGLVKDRQEFNRAVIAAGAEGRLQAGNFVIPSGATPAEIVSIITK